MHCNMNDVADVAFSSFYSTVGSQLQHADLSLSTPIHTLEHDSNFTGLFDDDPALLSLSLTALTGSATSAATATHKNATGVTETACIPFVQIHTTDLQQQHPEPGRSYRNGFRRRNAEIKSEAELIKSELAEAAAKERINATPTPPTATKTISNESCSDLPLHKCPSCPFLSLCQQTAQTHISSCFGVDPQQRLQCPGCANIFYSFDVLHLHFSSDHQLEPQEIAKLTGKPIETTTKKLPQQQQQLQTEESLPKSRIFIKNVDCLREPHREQDALNQLPDMLQMFPSPPDCSTSNILDLLDDVDEEQEQEQQQILPMSQKPAVQKISIKSVDVLREPALLPFDFQLPSVVEQLQPLPPLPSLLMGSNMLDVEPEKPRQPKIYIRNVDILKEPMLLPGMGFSEAPTTTTIQSPVDMFAAETLLTPTGPVGPLPGFEPALAPLANMCGEAFNFDAVLSGGASTAGSNNSVSGTNFSALDLDFGVDFEQSVQLEPTPPPPAPPPMPLPLSASVAPLQQPLINAQLTELGALPPDELENYISTTATGNTSSKQKIFIKNVDILKAPQRGTLHLRTVDELNLMNRNEVEHLIVPNREPLQLEELSLNPAAVALESTLVDFEQAPSAPLSYDDSYDLAEDLECWPWIDSMPTGMVATETEQDVTEQLELPANAEDILIKDFPQLYAPPTPTAETVPPLVPVTGSPELPESTTVPAESLNSLPVPPLVPLAADAPAAAAPAAAAEKPARIYVANNLLPAAVEPPPLPGGTSVRGRPYGAKQAGQSKRRPAQAAVQSVEGGKCTVEGCMFRFKSPTTLDYHQRCHNGSLSSAQPMICPECRSTQFSNWNCLHTHLWRTHEIDMELYCCQLCSFKTPIYSRLVNTHAKIHSEERNYKCEQCGKGFKNTKQLKNHRRLHRTQGLGMSKPTVPEEQQDVQPVVHRCEDCGAAFKQRKTLREHLCKQRNEQPQCSSCQRVFSSKSSLKLHMRSHQENKRFKCDKCEYEANDHNAFRRHVATHREAKRYTCPHCDFKAIQSTAYRIHLQKMHPEQELSTIIYKCKVCNFSSINRSLLLVHQAKHEATPNTDSSSKIKVKSSSLLVPNVKDNAEMEAGDVIV